MAILRRPDLRGIPSPLGSRNAVPTPMFIDDFAHSTRHGIRHGVGNTWPLSKTKCATRSFNLRRSPRINLPDGLLRLLREVQAFLRAYLVSG